MRQQAQPADPPLRDHRRGIVIGDKAAPYNGVLPGNPRLCE
ncbi:hypothetical protein [Telluria aromaticivorans]|nr:hypothetical protein [Telluria aromaticivorans]